MAAAPPAGPSRKKSPLALEVVLETPLVVVQRHREWSAITVAEQGADALPSHPKRRVVVAINGRRPTVEEGDHIPAGTSVRYAWNLAMIPGVKDSGALQLMAAKDMFAHTTFCNVVHGEPGTGKSKLMEVVIQNAAKLGQNVLCIAPTALVARAMPDGVWDGHAVKPMTVAMFLRRKLVEIVPSLAQPSIQAAKRRRKSSSAMAAPKPLLLLVDEAFMVRAEDLDATNRKVQGFHAKLRLVLFGDHMQLQPPRTVVGTWSSAVLKTARSTGDLAVYKLTKQRRFDKSPRMQELMADLRARRALSANHALQLLATEKRCPPVGTCRMVAATNALADEANAAAHVLFRTRRPAKTTRFVAAKGNPPAFVDFAPDELVRVRSNVFTIEEADKKTGKGGGVRYQQVNGMLGRVCKLPGGTVEVASTTRIEIKLMDTEEVIRVAPRRSQVMRAGRLAGGAAGGADEPAEGVPKERATTFLADEDDDEAGVASDVDGEGTPGDDGGAGGSKKRKRRPSAWAWSFEEALTPSTGQTVHAVQGATFEDGEKCVVNMKGFPRTRDGYNMLIVALSRVKSTKDLFIHNFDPAILPTLAAACQCGCTADDGKAPFPLAHNAERLKSLEDHLEALDCFCRVVYIPVGDFA